MPPHIVLPNGQWRFVKRGTKSRGVRRKTRVVSVARRRRSYRRYAGRARRFGGKFRGGGGNFKDILDGAIVGVAQTAIPDMIPMQDPLIAIGVGWFRRNPTLKVIGGMQLGAALGGMIGGGTGALKIGGVQSQV